MGENSSAPTLLESKNTIISKDLSPDSISKLNGFLKSMGVFNLTFPSQYDTKDSFSELTRGFLKVQHIHRGKISCIVSVKPPIMNFYGSLHGGAVGAVAARVATGCARTIVGKDKELFLGELSISYLSGAPRNNVYRSMHGGAVGAVAERVSIACARTVVAKDKELFLGELGMSYISAAPSNAEVIVDGSVIRSGRNLTVVAVEFRLKDSGKLVYTSNATFYHIPVASL